MAEWRRRAGEKAVVRGLTAGRLATNAAKYRRRWQRGRSHPTHYRGRAVAAGDRQIVKLREDRADQPIRRTRVIFFG